MTVYFTKKALMNGANLQIYLHEKMPHVFPMYNLSNVKSFTEGWNEIRSFIRDITNGTAILTKAERVHWDGSRDDLVEEDYIIMSRDQVSLWQIDLTISSYNGWKIALKI